MYKYCMRISSISNCRKAAELGIYNIEADLPLESYTPDDMEDLRDLLIDNGMRIVLLTSKIPSDDIDGLRKLFVNAHLLNVENIRLNIPSDYAAKLSDSLDISLVFENDEEAVKAVSGSSLVFDPTEYVSQKLHPFLHTFTQSHLKSRVKFLRIKDKLYDGTPTAPGIGSAEIKELVSILLSRSFDGYFALEEADAAEALAYMKRILKRM